MSPSRHTIHSVAKGGGQKKAALVSTLVALLLIVSGCTIGQQHLEQGGDPTSWIGATAWLIRADIVAQEDVREETRHLDLVVKDVLFQSPTYFWLNEFQTPALVADEKVLADITLPSTRIDLLNQSVVVALQAAGEPADLEAGVRSNDGERSHSAILILDAKWNLIEAGGNHFEVYRNVLQLYPSNPNGVLSLIADASVKLNADNEAFLAERDLTPDELEAVPDQPRALTPGPLGEWRRANGFEFPANSDQVTAESLDRWINTPPEERQLFVTPDEVIPGSDAQLELDGWVEREMVITNSDTVSEKFSWLGVRFPGVGVLGPFSSTAEEGFVTLYGFAPLNHSAELVGWVGSSFPDLTQAVVISPVPEPLWGPSNVIWIEILGNELTGYSIEAVDPDELPLP